MCDRQTDRQTDRQSEMKVCGRARERERDSFYVIFMKLTYALACKFFFVFLDTCLFTEIEDPFKLCFFYEIKMIFLKTFI